MPNIILKIFLLGAKIVGRNAEKGGQKRLLFREIFKKPKFRKIM